MLLFTALLVSCVYQLVANLANSFVWSYAK